MRYLRIMGLMLLLGCGTVREAAGPELRQTPEAITISVANRPILTYRIAPDLPAPTPGDTVAAYYQRSGFLHPVRSPAGHTVTDDFPVGYRHQHGVFTAWTNTTFRGEFHDFWNQHKETATVEHVELLETYDSTAVAGFRARLRHRSLRHGTVLDEVWTVRVHATPDDDLHVFDLRSEQTNVTGDTLFLNTHLYGGLGVRGSARWNARDSLHFYRPADFRTSEGLTRADGNHSRPDWVAIYGELPGATDAAAAAAGLAILPHPDNFRAPQFVRLHPDLPYLSVTPVAQEGFALPPGGKYLSRYRFVVFDGAPDAARLAAHAWRSDR